MAKSDEKAAEEERDESEAPDAAGEDEDGDGDEVEAEAGKPTAVDRKAAASHVEDGEDEDEGEADDPLPAPPPKPAVQAVTPPPPAASLGKSVMTFTIVLGGLFVMFFLLGNAESPFGNNQGPKWKQGQTVPVDITLDPSDDTKLSCAAKADIGGKRCEYEDKTTKYTGALKDDTMLRPYTTLEGAHLLAAGVWSAPELEKGKRPTGRFTVRCDFKVEGKVNAPAIRWDFAGAWNEKNEEWFAGSASNCKLQK